MSLSLSICLISPFVSISRTPFSFSQFSATTHTQKHTHIPNLVKNTEVPHDMFTCPPLTQKLGQNGIDTWPDYGSLTLCVYYMSMGVCTQRAGSCMVDGCEGGEQEVSGTELWARSSRGVGSLIDAHSDRPSFGRTGHGTPTT